ncbi:hypothetical protein [Chitinimonas sp. BJB300]|uniref:hypothetical protein n=1 Tax=Chitinimonas sp. BJB300 TaxID=1559339 RepID=UPI000C0EEE3F|nr:hypothetical protein [Chitinimonas sp. BJB300]PHV11687.1 hypothetical protein CSQ89_09555 [Chitinimonas sp. BJB300]TSJ88586.1 hypothetical protein FG002_010515 [Chitinimonas sp. BJB300]
MNKTQLHYAEISPMTAYRGLGDRRAVLAVGLPVAHTARMHDLDVIKAAVLAGLQDESALFPPVRSYCDAGLALQLTAQLTGIGSQGAAIEEPRQGQPDSGPAALRTGGYMPHANVILHAGWLL